MSSSPIYTEVEPDCGWVQGEEFDTLLVDVSGFKKEELKAQVDTSNNLKISGERQMGGNQWRRFLKSFPLPENCDARMIKARFDDGILYVQVPKPTAEDHLPQPSDGHANNEQGGRERREEKDSSAQAVARNNVHVPETSKQGMEDVAKGLAKRRRLMVNFVVVAIVVFIGLGTFVGYKLRSLKGDT